jgi:exodeoxyribonuclease V alpha subunit
VDKDVYNGDRHGEDVDLDESEFAVIFDGRSVSFAFGELDALVPACAATIHKSQKSAYPPWSSGVMTQR